MPAFELNSYQTNKPDGYGKMARGLQEALWNHVDWTDKASNVINFCRPPDYKFKSGITIGYTPWESTEVPYEWNEPMRQVDQLWTTASWLRYNWQARIRPDVFILPHGIDPMWEPIRRQEPETGQPFRFLHVGGEASRKGADVLLKIWYEHFKDRDDLELVFKCHGGLNAIVKDEEGSIICRAAELSNVRVINKTVNSHELWQLYALSHCMVYPSHGEGFGLIPFEAMATGLPTILTYPLMGDFAHYAHKMIIGKYEPVPELYEKEHPGMWMQIDEHIIAEEMNDVIHNYKYRAAWRAYDHAHDIHEQYSWDRIAEQAMDRIKLLM